MQIDKKTLCSVNFAHIRIPKRMLTDLPYKALSPEAKLTYGAIADRSSLSHKNRHKFTNKKGEVFCYFPREEIMRLLGCKHDKAGKVLKELTQAGLVKLTRCGIGKPYQIVLTPIDWGSPRKKGNDQSEKPLRDSGLTDHSLDGKTDGNNTEEENPYANNPEVYLRRFFRYAIRYDELITDYDPTLVDRILDIAVSILTQETGEFLIGDIRIPAEIIQEEIRDLKQEHVVCTLNKLKHATYVQDHSDIFVLSALHESIAHQYRK